MIINTALASSLAVAADKSIAEVGDAETKVPALILPVEKILTPHNQLSGGLGRVANGSFFTHLEELKPAATGPTATVIVTLTRGLWTIAWVMSASYQSNVFQAVTAIQKFLIAFQANTQNIAVMHKGNNCQNLTGIFRVLLNENADLRLDVAATGAGDAVNTTVCLQAEKNI